MPRPRSGLSLPLAVLLSAVGLSLAAAPARGADGDAGNDDGPSASDLLAAAKFLPPPVPPPLLASDNLLTNGPTTGPSESATTKPVDQPNFSPERTLSELVGHFAPYEPIYIVAGPYDPLVRFQFSFKYRLFNPASSVGKIPVLGQINFAYTQLSLWQLDKPSSPFYDTNYQPEAFYNDDDVQWVKIPTVSQFGLMAGFGHDSNGRAGPLSRQVNILFARPTFNFGDPNGFHAYVSPKAYVYVGDTSENPDIARFRGYVDARFVVGWRYGLEFSLLGRIGSRADRGSVLMDLTYPLKDLLYKNVDLYLDLQYFDGYGEVLRNYNQRTQALRFGFALVR